MKNFNMKSFKKIALIISAVALLIMFGVVTYTNVRMHNAVEKSRADYEAKKESIGQKWADYEAYYETATFPELTFPTEE